jgi:hypothetical protein
MGLVHDYDRNQAVQPRFAAQECDLMLQAMTIDLTIIVQKPDKVSIHRERKANADIAPGRETQVVRAFYDAERPGYGSLCFRPQALHR